MLRNREARPGHRAVALSTLVAVAVLAVGACGSSSTTSAPPATTAPTAPGTTGTPAAAAEGSVTLLSYNVAGLPKEISKVDPLLHIPTIATKLSPYDVVLTQEDFDWWQPQLDALDFSHYHERLRAETSMFPFRSDRHPGPAAAGLDAATRPTLLVGDGLGYLSKLPVRDVQRVAWKNCFGGANTKDGGASDCLSMKGFMVGTYTLGTSAAGPVEADIYSWHMEAGATAADQDVQKQDLDQLAAFMEQHSKGRAIILTGDSNLHTGNDTNPDGRSGDSTDTDLWNAFQARTGVTDMCASFACVDPDSIDKLAFRSSDTVKLTPTARAYPTQDFKDDEGEDLSDHPPLVVTVAWRRAA